MTSFGENNTGAERDAALENLRVALRDQFDIPHVDQSDTEPDHDQYWAIHEKLFNPFSLDRGVFTKNPYSPTPGDPGMAIIEGHTYSESAVEYMFKKITNTRNKLNAKSFNGWSSTLTDSEIATMQQEISIQHEHEVEKNVAAFTRLRLKFTSDPSSIPLNEADKIEKVRGIDATTSERLELLALHPEIDAIEDMKFTSALDFSAYYDAHSDYRDRLDELNKSNPDTPADNRFIVRLMSSDEQMPRPRNLSEDVPEQVRADKTVIAEILDSQSGLVFEAVEKTSWYSFDIARNFSTLIPHVANGMKELPIYTQVYLRLKRDRRREGELREQERQYDFQQLFIRMNNKQRYIEDL